MKMKEEVEEEASQEVPSSSEEKKVGSLVEDETD